MLTSISFFFPEEQTTANSYKVKHNIQLGEMLGVNLKYVMGQRSVWFWYVKGGNTRTNPEEQQ